MTKPRYEGPSAAMKLARIAQDRYTFGVSDTGEPYALPLDGPRIVKMLRGAGSLRAELAAAFLTDFGNPPPQQALADALMALEGLALGAKTKPLALRVADSHGALWFDLGDDTGELVRIAPEGWQIVSEAPVLHRRTALTAALPRPVIGGNLSALWSLLNIAAADRPVLVAFLVAALMPNMPHPILLLTGEQGTGKSTAAKIIASVVDASTVQLRKPPRDLDSWTTAAVGSHVVAVDNLSTLPDWLSDALCRASTGDGDVRRRLYTDGDLHVISFRRVVILNGIDLGAVRDDLADRLVTVDLHRIEESARARDDDLTQRWQAAAPLILGGLLDLTARVLAILPSVHLERSPRMADFAHVLAAVDQLAGTEGLARYRALAGELARDAVTSDPVLLALTSTISMPWDGPAAELLDILTATLHDTRPPKGWPSGARVLASLLKRRAPSLRRLGWTVEQLSERSERGTLWQIDPPSERPTNPDENPDEIVSSAARQDSRQASAPVLACKDVESGWIPDELTNNTPNLSVHTEQRVRTREVPDSSSSRHSVTDCLACGEPLAADLIADNIHRHIGCAA
jgi:DNA polymerase III delta prime subunit